MKLNITHDFTCKCTILHDYSEGTLSRRFLPLVFAQSGDRVLQKVPDATFLHRLADIADAQTMPRYRTELAVDTKFKEGYTFDPVTEADREAEIALRAAIEAESSPSSARNWLTEVVPIVGC